MARPWRGFGVMRESSPSEMREAAFAAGREWYKGLRQADRVAFDESRHEGDFDWEDWFNERPEPGFLKGADHEAHMQEVFSE